MRLSVAAALLVVLGLMQPGSVSLFDLPEDFEGSGPDLEGSGSGDDGENGDFSSEDLPAITPEQENKHGIKVPTPGSVVIGGKWSFWGNKQVLAGAAAGGITGAALGATLSAILIYKWRKKDEEECILSQKKFLDDNY
ncbi:syndecan-1 [Kryptolebias marmoratus]|uniref:syndecan-1 n=1 Tax=Kryptolebias marmoratus TaxID=37003 RepID=UPI0007F94326|nr:syndecan-1 [Kryptolebias marmoratus]